MLVPQEQIQVEKDLSGKAPQCLRKGPYSFIQKALAPWRYLPFVS